MKTMYETPNMEVIEIIVEDVVTASGDGPLSFGGSYGTGTSTDFGKIW